MFFYKPGSHYDAAWIPGHECPDLRDVDAQDLTRSDKRVEMVYERLELVHGRCAVAALKLLLRSLKLDPERVRIPEADLARGGKLIEHRDCRPGGLAPRRNGSARITVSARPRMSVAAKLYRLGGNNVWLYSSHWKAGDCWRGHGRRILRSWRFVAAWA